MTQRQRDANGSRAFTRRDLLKLAAAMGPSIALPGWSATARAQDAYPTRPIDIIYGFGAGSSGDLTCRLMAGYLRKKWNVAINVLNKPGGNTVPASLDLYQAAPDGYTLMGDAPGSSSMVAASVKSLPFKVMDRTFIAMIGASGMILVVPPTSPLKSLKDLADELKKDPEQFTWTSQGAATGDLLFRKFAKAVGVDITKTRPITVRSAPEISTLTAGGQVKLGVLVIAAALPAIQGGLVRPLAQVTVERSPSLPDVPTAGEQGFPNIATPTFIGLTGPPKLPQPIVDKWNVALQEMLKDPEMVSQLNRIGSTPFYLNSRDFKQYVSDEAALVEKMYG
jgi:tripartite-type tricarboxylate transporter receptor subunit TctC